MKLYRFFFIPILLIVVVSLYFNFRAFKSYQQQSIFLTNINSNNYTFTDKLDEIETEFPNISVTSMNLRVIKAKYLIEDEQYERALSLLNTVKYDPVHYKDALKADIFLRKFQLDSLFNTSKKAFIGLPLNSAHWIYYCKSLSLFKEFETAIDIYKKYNLRNGDPKWAYHYFATMYPHLEKYPIVKKQAIKALDRFQFFKYSGNINQELNVILYYIIYGEENYKTSLENYNEGGNLFNKKEFKAAAEKYKKASKSFPINPNYYYDEMICYYKLGIYEEVVSIYNNIDKNIIPMTGSFEFLVGSTFLKNKEPLKACKFFRKSYKKGFINALSYTKKTCK